MTIPRILICAVAAAVTMTAAAAQAQPAPDANSVLILGSTVGPADPSLEEATALAQGFTVVVDTDAEWLARTTADFATFQAIILGDPTCRGPGPTTAAEANRTVWSPAITGNIVVIGTDPTFHSSFAFGAATQGDVVTDSGIAFATDDDQTGAYITLSCYFDGALPNTPVLLLDQFGSFTVQGASCWNDAHIVASHPALTGLTDASLSNWSCSSHEVFNSFPSTFLALVIAEDYNCPSPPGTGTNYGDGTCGTPYIIARGEELVPAACGDGTVDAGEECDDGNTTNGDGCSAQCTIEVAVSLPGRMTGGGRVTGTDVSHGFTLHCDVAAGSNNLQVNWDGGKFHLEALTSAACSDNPAIGPEQPAAGFDTYTGSGMGRYNGEAGAIARWTFTDAGEPGRNDTVTIEIVDASSAVVLSVTGTLRGGNHQAHK